MWEYINLLANRLTTVVLFVCLFLGGEGENREKRKIFLKYTHILKYPHIEWKRNLKWFEEIRKYRPISN